MSSCNTWLKRRLGCMAGLLSVAVGGLMNERTNGQFEIEQRRLNLQAARTKRVAIAVALCPGGIKTEGIGTRSGIRTLDHPVKSRVLWPAELSAQRMVPPRSPAARGALPPKGAAFCLGAARRQKMPHAAPLRGALPKSASGSRLSFWAWAVDSSQCGVSSRARTGDLRGHIPTR